MEKERRKGGLQPDGSWLMIEDPIPFTITEKEPEKPKEVPESDDKEEKTTEIKFRRNKRGRVEAVYPDGRTSEIVDMGDLIGLEGAPYTPEEYIKSRNVDEEHLRKRFKGTTVGECLLELYGEKRYREMVEAGVIKDPDFK